MVDRAAGKNNIATGREVTRVAQIAYYCNSYTHDFAVGHGGIVNILSSHFYGLNFLVSYDEEISNKRGRLRSLTFAKTNAVRDETETPRRVNRRFFTRTGRHIRRRTHPPACFYPRANTFRVFARLPRRLVRHAFPPALFLPPRLST